jgi:hypothetical protein
MNEQPNIEFFLPEQVCNLLPPERGSRFNQREFFAGAGLQPAPPGAGVTF